MATTERVYLVDVAVLGAEAFGERSGLKRALENEAVVRTRHHCFPPFQLVFCAVPSRRRGLTIRGVPFACLISLCRRS